MRGDMFDGVLAFTRVAEKRSFTAAAAELGVTVAGISWTIKQLEARVGAPLLTRTTRSVKLTEAGEVFLRQALVGVEHVAAGYEAARTLGRHPGGLLRLNFPTVAQALIEAFSTEFAAVHPDIELELAVEDRFVDIVAEGYDAGIRMGESIAQDMVAVRLTKPCQMTVVATPSYFERRGTPQRPEELADHACINFRMASGGIYRWAFEERSEDGTSRKFDMAVKGPLIVQGAGAGLSAALAGAGLTYAIESNVEPLVGQGRLEPCLQSFMPTMPGFFIYFPKQARVLPKLRTFLDFWAHTRHARLFPLDVAGGPTIEGRPLIASAENRSGKFPSG